MKESDRDIAKALLILSFMSASSLALAQSGRGRIQACRPDVRRFCSRVPRGADQMEFLNCLELNRDRLSRPCLAVLIDHGR